MKVQGSTVIMEVFELKSLLSEAVTLGLQRYEEHGKSSPYISKREAFKRFGRVQVCRWIKEGLIEEKKDGDKNHRIRISLEQIMTVAAASNRTSFYKHKYAED